MEVIRKLRTERNLTLKELGSKCGLSFICINNIELMKKKPQVLSISKLAKALDVSYDELYDAVEEEWKNKPVAEPEPSEEPKSE